MQSDEENLETDLFQLYDLKVEVVSGKTEHGTMLGSLGNIAAILRYNPNRN